MTLFSREFFDTLIIVVVIIGLAFAALRLYRDFTRPLPPEFRPGEDDTPQS
jgi:cytochrome c oxidase assembly protein Cox11